MLAAERTLLAWIRTGLALMGFGFVVARFGLFLRELATMKPVEGGAGPHHTPATQQFSLSLWAGVAMILIGVVVTVLAAVKHWQTVDRLNRGELLPFRRLSLGVILAVALGIIGLVIAAYLMIGLNHSG